MRVILDANIYLSYLLAPDTARTMTYVVRAAFGPGLTLLLPSELLDDLQDKLTAKAYFQKHVNSATAAALLEKLHVVAVVPPRLSVASPEFTRDPKDDYLVAYGLLYDVDYLVTGDPDLLDLGQVAALQIVTPVQFLDRLASL